MTSTRPQALVIVFDGIEELEALTPVDILRRAAVDVTMASVTDQQTVVGSHQISFAADTSLSLVDPKAFDLVLLPGGAGVHKLIDNPTIRDLLKTQDKAGKELAAICAAPKILAAHGILHNRNATSHTTVRKDLPKPSDAPVVVDGHITTSQGPGTAVEFSLALVRKLKDEQTAQQISDFIHCPQ